MTIECYNNKCAKHSCNSGDPRDEGSFCYETECRFEPLNPPIIAFNEVSDSEKANILKASIRAGMIRGLKQQITLKGLE